MILKKIMILIIILVGLKEGFSKTNSTKTTKSPKSTSNSTKSINSTKPINSTLSGRSSEDNATTPMDCYQCRSDLNGSCAEHKPSAAYLTPCPSFDDIETVELMDKTVKSKDVWCRKIVQNTAFVNDTPTITYIRECTAFHKSTQQCYYVITQLFSITVCECNDKMGCNFANVLNGNVKLLGFMVVNLIVFVSYLMK